MKSEERSAKSETQNHSSFVLRSSYFALRTSYFVLLLAAALAGLWAAVAPGGRLWLQVFAPPIAIVALLLLLALGLGGVVLRRLSPAADNALERETLAAALGLGLISTVLALLGLAGWLKPIPVLALSALGLLAFYRRVKTAARGPGGFPWGLRSSGLLTPTALTLAAAALAMAFLAALAPPLSYDVLEYHLAVPREWLRAGRLVDLPYNFYSQLPFGVETLYGFGMMLEGGGDAAPKLINFALLALTCLAVAALARRMGATFGLGALAAAHFAANHTTMRIYVDAFADMGAALFVTASALSVFAWPERRWGRGALLTGMLAGFALCAKTATAGLYLAPALLFLVLARPSGAKSGDRHALKLPKASQSPFFAFFALVETRASGRRMIAGAVFLLSAAAAFSPWPLRNALLTGDPAAPFLNAWFGADPWRLETERFWLGMHGWGTPLSLEHLRALFSRLGVVGWPWVLGVLAALIAGDRMTRRVALTAMGGYCAYGLLGGAPDRFAIPLIALAIALTHGAVAQALRPGSASRRLVTILLTLAAIPPLWGAAKNMTACENLKYAALAMDRADYEEGLLGATARLFRQTEEKSPDDARFLLIYEARAALLRRPSLANTVFDKSPLLEALRRRAPGESLASRLRADGFTHILVNEYELARLIATHAPPAVLPDPLYKQLQTIPDQWRRFEELARHPEWYAPYSRMKATDKELAEIAIFLETAYANPLAREPAGALRLFASEIPR